MVLYIYTVCPAMVTKDIKANVSGAINVAYPS